MKTVHTKQQWSGNLLVMKWIYRQARWLTLVTLSRLHLSFSSSYPREWITVGRNHDVFLLFPKMDLWHKEEPTKPKNRPQLQLLAGLGSGGKPSLKMKRGVWKVLFVLLLPKGQQEIMILMPLRPKNQRCEYHVLLGMLNSVRPRCWGLAWKMCWKQHLVPLEMNHYLRCVWRKMRGPSG